MISPYGHSLALLSDLYQLTMAAGYWQEGLADREAVFHHFFRSAPFGGAYAVAAGIPVAMQWLSELKYADDDLAYLASLATEGGEPLFEDRFLDSLRQFAFECDVDAVAEGTVVHAHEPLVRVRGPLLQCQLAETALLNIVNFQTLVATKAARVCLAAEGDPVLEFGLRRAQGIDGGLSASRAAYIGGCAATSNVLAGKIYGIPVRGTHAHSWVMAFETETESFEAYARSMPHDTVLLVDTYDTREGVRRAIQAGTKLRAQGFRLAGIRLDSGDLDKLSAEARHRLDEAGFQDTAIVGSGDLDETSIAELKRRGAKVSAWGVGTSIASAKGQSALGGVYKLALLRDGAGNWQGKAKRSDDPAKASTPGMLQVRRFFDKGTWKADLIYDELEPPNGPWRGVDPSLGEGARRVELEGRHEDLLHPTLKAGRVLCSEQDLIAARQLCRSQLDALPDEVRKGKPDYTAGVLLEDSLMSRRATALRRAGPFQQRC